MLLARTIFIFQHCPPSQTSIILKESVNPQYVSSVTRQLCLLFNKKKKCHASKVIKTPNYFLTKPP
ncbi:hypothetical protein Scep_025342 [Stephania cephalantha]|uniref:Uncharacterized protein n=1 Tax=Stephania cephalantha TaxID=152367 RepID=A0AAP0ENN8_9MAGN